LACYCQQSKGELGCYGHLQVQNVEKSEKKAHQKEVSNLGREMEER